MSNETLARRHWEAPSWGNAEQRHETYLGPSRWSNVVVARFVDKNQNKDPTDTLPETI